MKPEERENLISPAEFLWRRTWFHPEKKYFNPDGSLTSRAFTLREKDEGKLSVDVKSLSTLEKSLADPSLFRLLEIAASAVYKIELFACHDPLPDNPAHAYIGGMHLDDDLKPKLLAEQAYLIFPK